MCKWNAVLPSSYPQCQRELNIDLRHHRQISRAPFPDLPLRFRFHAIPHLPSVRNVELVPPPVIYWSKAPVWGVLPTHGFRAHPGNVAWIFGRCEDKGCSRTCGALTWVRLRAVNRFMFTKLLTDIIFYSRGDAADKYRDAGRSSSNLSRSLDDSCQAQDWS
jgi:hypothetical protein